MTAEFLVSNWFTGLLILNIDKLYEDYDYKDYGGIDNRIYYHSHRIYDDKIYDDKIYEDFLFGEDSGKIYIHAFYIYIYILSLYFDYILSV